MLQDVMAFQIPSEFCALCLRDIAERRSVKGNTLLKHSGSSASEVADFLVGEKLSVDTLCFRCYRLILGTDYHQHEFKRLRNCLLKIYRERCFSIDNLRNSGFERFVIEASRSFGVEGTSDGVGESFGGNNELPILPPFPSDLNDLCLMRYRLPDYNNVVGDGFHVGQNTRNTEHHPVGKSSVVNKVKVRRLCQSEIQGQKRFVAGKRKNACGVMVRSSNRNKKTKKSEDYEYYGDASVDQYQASGSVAGQYQASGSVAGDLDSKTYCPLCSKDFSSRKEYINHPCMQAVEKDVLECKGCQKSFSVRQDYIKHIDVCYKHVSVKCPKCLTELPSAAYLPRHMEAFHDKTDLVRRSSLCDHCGRTFSRKEALQRHQAKVHGISHGIHQCSKCGKTFLHTSLLMEHMRAHKGYECSQCGKVFTCVSNLNIHKKTFHLNKMLYFCKPCNKRWRFHASYTNHMRKVHGNAPFKCSECNVLFSSENAFEKHKEKCICKNKNLVSNKLKSGTKFKKTKKTLKDESEMEKSRSDKKIDSSTGTSKAGDDSSHVNGDQNYVRLKRIVRKRTPPFQSESVKRSSVVSSEKLPSNRNENIGDLPSTNTNIEELTLPSSRVESNLPTSSSASLSPSHEIVLETIEDLSTDCQYVILVEDNDDIS